MLFVLDGIRCTSTSLFNNIYILITSITFSRDRTKIAQDYKTRISTVLLSYNVKQTPVNNKGSNGMHVIKLF